MNQINQINKTTYLRMAGLRKPLEDSLVEGFCNAERAACFSHRRYLRIAGIAEFPGKDGERNRGLYDTPQRGIYFQTGAA